MHSAGRGEGTSAQPLRRCAVAQENSEWTSLVCTCPAHLQLRTCCERAWDFWSKSCSTLMNWHWLKEIFGQHWDWRWIKGGLVQPLLPYAELHEISTGKDWVLSYYLLPFGSAATVSSKSSMTWLFPTTFALSKSSGFTVCQIRVASGKETPYITSQVIFKLC